MERLPDDWQISRMVEKVFGVKVDPQSRSSGETTPHQAGPSKQGEFSFNLDESFNKVKKEALKAALEAKRGSAVKVPVDGVRGPAKKEKWQVFSSVTVDSSGKKKVWIDLGSPAVSFKPRHRNSLGFDQRK